MVSDEQRAQQFSHQVVITREGVRLEYDARSGARDAAEVSVADLGERAKAGDPVPLLLWLVFANSTGVQSQIAALRQEAAAARRAAFEAASADRVMDQTLERLRAAGVELPGPLAAVLRGRA